jgi:CheY-like chemotaxis protein
VRAGERVGRVSGDADRLGQVVWNLLSNAVKFTPRGGRVEVSLSARDGHAEVAVADTGRGIAPEFLPQVFDRFRQADGRITREQGGLGLGLSIARHLVELHGGTISASSPGEGLGATFRFSLPLIQLRIADLGLRNDESDADDQSAIRNPQSAILRGLRVLVVDDDEDSRAVVSAVLERAGASVSTARSAAEALGLVVESRPDVLVADIGMPGVDGYELMRRVRALEPSQGGQTPAAALTAYASDQDRDLALGAGYQLHLAKPVAPADLLQAVAGLAGRQQ